MQDERAAASDACRRFMELFAGFPNGYGTTRILGTRNAAGKVDYESFWQHAPVTGELIARHLAGSQGIGICPIRADSTVQWAAIDIDEYKGLNAGKIATTLLNHSLPLVPCFSKSGGLHVFLFASEPIQASVMQSKLRSIAALLGHAGVEIFPKQHSIPETGGSWLNLPYFGDARRAVLPNGEELTLDQFLDLAEASRVNAAWFGGSEPGTRAPMPGNRKRDSGKTLFALPEAIADGARNSTLTAFAGSMRRTNASEEEILAALHAANSRRCNPPLSDSDVQRIAKSVGRYVAHDGPEEGLTQELAKAIKIDAAFARDAGGLLYAFESGVYKPTGTRVIERRVKELCQLWSKTKGWSPELATKVCQWIAVDSPELWERPPLDTLNCRNGLLDVNTRTLRPHSPDFLTPVQIEAAYNVDARCPAIDKFVNDVFPPDAHHVPWEISAWLMLPSTSIQKAILAIGSGANGKSVFLSLLQTFIGQCNVSAMSLHKIESDKFAAARLSGKLANVCPDLPTIALSGTSMFKALTGGDTINVERKFESSFELKPYARLVFSANDAPRSQDSSHGFFRRWLVIPFSRTFDEAGPDTLPRAILDARLSEPVELSGMLNRALDALPVIQRGHFTEAASTKAALDEFRRTTDPFSLWLEKSTIERPDAMTPKEIVRRAYAQVCQDSGRPVMGDVQFTGALKRLRPKVQPSKRRLNGVLTPVYIGLGLVTLDSVPDGQLF